MIGASLRISSLFLSIVILALTATFSARAEETVPSGEIEARVYDIQTIRPSRSGRVYLLEKFDEQMPVDGKIFLLRDGDTPVMAMRVLRTYSQTKRIAAKKLRAYPNFEKLERGSRFRAFEKVGDKVLPVPPSAEDLQDLKELESVPAGEQPVETVPTPPGSTGDLTEVPAPPSEVPAETSAEPPATEAPATEPATEASAAGEEGSGEALDESLELREDAEEEENDHYFPNSFTMMIGNVPDSNVPGPAFKFSGGMSYGRKLSSSLTLEGGFFYYKAGGEYVDASGTVWEPSMSVIPLIGTLRYQWRLSDSWTGYIYGGVSYPLVFGAIDAPVKLLQQIQVMSPAGGVGAFVQTGPNWYLRLNLGIDAMTVGVTLRY